MIEKKNIGILILAVVLLSALILACDGPGGAVTPNVQATVNAAVAATSTSQAGIQATVNAAVAATDTAQADIQPTATVAVTQAPKPTTSPAEYANVTEEELAAMIEQSVAQAVTASSQCSTAAADAAADNNVTPQEAQTVQVYITGSQEAVTYAEELISAYSDLYGELASESLAALQQIEQDLASIAESTAAINSALQELNASIEQGIEQSQEAIAELKSAALAAGAKAAEAQAQTKGWTTGLQSDRDRRTAEALAVKPNQVAADRQEALWSAFDYADAVRQALDDNKVSRSELADIAQLGANASASLNAQGGPQLQQLSGSINRITELTARGRTPEARASLGNFESSLGSRPERTDRSRKPGKP